MLVKFVTNFKCTLCGTLYPGGSGLGLELAAESDDVGPGDAPVAVQNPSCPSCGAGHDALITY